MQKKQQNPQWKKQLNSTGFQRNASARQGGGDSFEQVDQVSDDLLRKVPPHSVEAEQAVLGGVFLRGQVFHTIVDIVTEDDFYLPAHKVIFESFSELYRRNSPIDLITVAEFLKDKGLLEQAGGTVYLAELAESVISAANAEHYATMVRNKSLQRSLITACSDIIGNCFDASQDIEHLLDASESSIFSISERTTGKVFKSSKELVSRVFEDLEKRVERKELVTGVTTGYYRLDNMTAGLQPSDLIIIAARPSMGKTAFVLNMAMRAAVNSGTPVAIYSLEMSMESLMMRMLCAWGKVDLGKLRKGFLDDEDWAKLYTAADALSQAPIYIDDTPSITTLDLRARTRRLHSDKGVGMVVVDYLQLMRSSRRTDSRELEISDISRNLKALAKELHIPVIALSQLNRKVEERTNKRPMLSDLRESGAIEQDADIIMFVYRDEVYNKRDDNPKKGVAEIIIGKQRNGPTGTAELAYIGSYTAFEDLAEVPPPSEDFQ